MMAVVYVLIAAHLTVLALLWLARRGPVHTHEEGGRVGGCAACGFGPDGRLAARYGSSRSWT